MDEIIRLCKEIKDNKKCLGCGVSKYDGCECIYCGRINEKLKLLVDKLISVLNNTTDFDNKTLINLFNIKDLNIKEVNAILDRYNFDNIIDSRIDNLIQNRFSATITNDDAYLFSTLIEGNTLNIQNIDFITMNLMRYMIMGKLDISNEKKKVVIKNFTEIFMRDKIKNPICIYSGKLDVQGDSFYNIIRFNESDIDKLLEEGDYIELLRLIFHECTHTHQHYYIDKGSLINYLILLQTKEQIIRNYYPNYYRDNYKLYLEEVEARYNEYYSLLQIMQVFGLKMSDKSISVLHEEMINENKNMEDRKRVINGNQTTLDELFDSIKLSANDLYKYPLLNLEYKIDNGNVVKKSVDELQSDYDVYLQNMKTPKEKEEIDYLYSRLIGEKVNKK